MAKFSAEGFRSIRKGAEIDYTVIDNFRDAAQVFANRLARRYSRRNRAVIQHNNQCGSTAEYQVTIVASSGTIEAKEWLYVSYKAD